MRAPIVRFAARPGSGLGPKPSSSRSGQHGASVSRRGAWGRFGIALIWTGLLLGGLAPSSSADGDRPEGSDSAESGQIVSRIGSPKTHPVKPPVKPPPRTARELGSCRPPGLAVLALDPASQRAVVREAEAPPRVVRPGSEVAAGGNLVRWIGAEKLVLASPPALTGERTVWWIYPAERPTGGQRAERSGPLVRCFLPGVAASSEAAQ